MRWKWMLTLNQNRNNLWPTWIQKQTFSKRIMEHNHLATWFDNKPFWIQSLHFTIWLSISVIIRIYGTVSSKSRLYTWQANYCSALIFFSVCYITWRKWSTLTTRDCSSTNGRAEHLEGSKISLEYSSAKILGFV